MRYAVTGKNGKVLDIKCLDTNPIFLTGEPPCLEVRTDDLNNDWFYVFSDSPKFSIDFLKRFCESVFKQWGKFGPYNDLMIVRHIKYENRGIKFEFMNVETLGNCGYPKPYTASDLVPIIEDKNGKRFFIGIIRSKFGADKIGLIGGKREKKGCVYETPSINILHEAWEETEISLTFGLDEIERFKTCPYEVSYPMYAVLGSETAMGQVSWIGIYPTGDKELNSTYGQKRVDETCAYLFFGKVDCELSEEVIRANIKAGDDAKDLHIIEVTGEESCPEFYNDHHTRIFLDAFKRVKEIEKK